MKLKRIAVLSALLIAVLCISALAFDVQGGEIKTNSAVNFRAEASTSSEILDKLYNDSRVAVLGEKDGFYKAAYNGKTGFIAKSYVELSPIMNVNPGNAKITASALNVRSAPGTTSSVVDKLYEGSVAEIIGINSGWFKISLSKDKKGYIHPDYVEITGGKTSELKTVKPTNTKATLRQNIVNYALRFKGVPYVHGGETPSGFDCSGLVQYVYKNFGYSVARTSADQYAKSVKKIKKSELDLGDLVFFSRDTAGVVGHVGIYIGNGMFVHAPCPGKKVKEEELSNEYYVSHYIGSGTVVGE